MTLSCDLCETTKHESSKFEPFRNLLLHAASIWVVSGTRIDWKGFQEPIPLASSNGDALQGSTRSTNEIKKDLYLLTITNSELLLILVSSSCYHLQRNFTIDQRGRSLLEMLSTPRIVVNRTHTSTPRMS
jgi:hypothetical protein